MMAEAPTADLRDFRLSAVIALDLVKHSGRDKNAIQQIQAVMESVLQDTIDSLRLSEVLFNHTGDGYICTLLGDCSVRLMDFVNVCFPTLLERLSPYKQHFRAGIDFGIVHLKKNNLTDGSSYFDLPGILSARLESVAEQDQILCTDTIFTLFLRHYRGMFSETARIVQTKDRELYAYVITPQPVPQIRYHISNFLFGPREWAQMILRQQQKKILVVDDEPRNLEIMEKIIGEFVSSDKVVAADSAKSALRAFKPGEFSLVLTDIIMPGSSGVDLAQEISRLDPYVTIMLVSGYSLEGLAKDALRNGYAAVYLQKPFTIEDLLYIVALALTFSAVSPLHGGLRVLTDNPVDFLLGLYEIRMALNNVIAWANDHLDVGDGLLRHKAKQIGNDFLRRMVPGADVIPFMRIAAGHLHRLETLARVVKRSEKTNLQEHLGDLVADYRDANPKTKIELRCPTLTYADFGILESVTVLIVSEFIDNALDAMDRKGRISVKVTYSRARQMVRINVADNGPGVPDGLSANIFSHPVSSKGAGRGMGLGLVKQACEAFRGTAEYHRDEATNFVATLCLPLPGKGNGSEQTDRGDE